MNYKFLIFLVLCLLPIADAAVTGNISLTTTQNSTSIVSGAWGSTYNFYCNTDSTCHPDDKCILDYDDNSANFSSVVYKGWCDPKSETRCRHENVFYASGTKRCDGGVRSCSSGVWTSTTCSANKTCSNGECVAESSSSSGGGTTSPAATTTTTKTTATAPPAKPSGLTLTLPPDFNITQGESVIKEISVKNTGELSLPSVVLSISGIDWHSITPEGGVNISVGLSAQFTVNFTIPENAEVKEYTVTVEAKNESAATSSSFKIRILPSNMTVEATIIPLYSEYLMLVEQLENNITDLQNKGTDVAELKNILDSIKDKLSQTNSSLNSQDYFTANVLLNEAKLLISDLQNKLIAPKPGEFKIDLIYIIVPVLIGITAFVAYLFWPTRM